MNESSLSQDLIRTKNLPRRCPVFKIDLIGRFVNIDDLTAGFLGFETEYFFGKNIEEFLDEKSFEAIESILALGRNYETFYKSVDLTFIDANQTTHTYEAVISLNFIGGNPANFQFILTDVSPERISIIDKKSCGEITIGDQLIRLIARVDNEINWNELSDVLISYPGIYQAAIYLCTENSLRVVADKSIDGEDKPKIDLSAVDRDFIDSFFNDEIALPEENIRVTENNLIDYLIPLVWNSRKWGLIRFIADHSDSEFTEWVMSLAGFIGNSLGGIVCRTEQKEENSPQIPINSAIEESFVGILKEYYKKISNYAARLSADSCNRLQKDGRVCLNSILETCQKLNQTLVRLEDLTRFLVQVEELTEVSLGNVLNDLIIELKGVSVLDEEIIERGDLPSIRTQENKIRLVFRTILSNIIWPAEIRQQPFLRISSTLENKRCEVVFELNLAEAQEMSRKSVRSSFIRLESSGEGNYLAGPELLLISKIVRSMNGEITLQGDFRQTASIIISFPGEE